MVTVISRFRVRNGLEEEVRRAFINRPRLVENAPGFCGLDVMTDAADPSIFLLLTRWTDEASFQNWHCSEAHHQSHCFMPRGLKLDPSFTSVTIGKQHRRSRCIPGFKRRPYGKASSMTPASVSKRSRLAQKFVSVKTSVAEAITDDFFLEHPDWTSRYGEHGRQHCTADACFHMAFLAGAMEAGSPQAFGDYLRWTARMLGARGIGAHTLEENLAQLEQHLAMALSTEDRQALSTFLEQARQAYAASDLTSDRKTAASRLDLVKRVYFAAILSGQRQAALNIIEEALQAGHSQLDIYVEVFAEAQHQLGELWQMNKITVAQEHMATSITLYAIAAIYPRQLPATIHRGTMVVTGVVGEMHQIGANLFADAMEAKGWTVCFLGTDLPNSSVLAAVEESSADLLCISTTLVSNLPAVAELVRAVRRKLSERPLEIILGGAAYRFTSAQFAREVGADEVTDLRGALATLCGQQSFYRSSAAQ